MNRIRIRTAVLAIAVFAPVALAGCFGSGGSSSSSSATSDPSQVLSQTFSNPNHITSGVLDLSLKASAGSTGNFTATLHGPFQGSQQNPSSLPQLDWTLSASGQAAGQSFSFDGGLTATSNNAYVTYKGQPYEVGTSTFQQFKSAFEQASAQAQAGQKQGQSFSSSCQQAVQAAGGNASACNIDFTSWLTNLQSNGTADVSGTSTNHISADLNVDKMFTDIANVASQLGSSGFGSSGLGTPPVTGAQLKQQLDQAKAAITNAHIDIYSGTSDNLLRKLDINLTIDPSKLPSSTPVPIPPIDLTFSIAFSGVNQPQTIQAPSGAKPISDLLSQLGIGGIGPLGGTSVPGVVPGGGTSGGGTSGGTSGSTKYTQCIQKAVTPADYKKCLALIQ